MRGKMNYSQKKSILWTLAFCLMLSIAISPVMAKTPLLRPTRPPLRTRPLRAKRRPPRSRGRARRLMRRLPIARNRRTRQLPLLQLTRLQRKAARNPRRLQRRPRPARLLRQLPRRKLLPRLRPVPRRLRRQHGIEIQQLVAVLQRPVGRVSPVQCCARRHGASRCWR